MAFSLSSERPRVAAVTINPFRAVFAWLARARARHARQVALSHLLDLDAALLDDLGIERADVIAALADPRLDGRAFALRRAHRADDWLAHP